MVKPFRINRFPVVALTVIVSVPLINEKCRIPDRSNFINHLSGVLGGIFQDKELSLNIKGYQCKLLEFSS